MATSVARSESDACDDTSSTPSTCPALTYRSTLSCSCAVSAMSSTSVIDRSASAAVAPRRRSANVGSEKRSCCDSVNKNASEFDLPVARVRAA